MYLKKFTFFLCLLGFMFSADPASALYFKAGDQAALKITQKMDLEIKQVKGEIHSTSSFDLTVKLLSVNPQTGGYPYNVELIVKKMDLSHTEKQGKKSVTFAFNSAGNKNSTHMKDISKLINTPILFTIDGPKEIRETSGVLNQFFWEWDNPSEFEIFGANEDAYIQILTQLFHLSGENLVLKQNYSADCSLILDPEWEDEEMEDFTVQTTCTYTIQSMNSNTMDATYAGNLSITSLSPLGPYLKVGLKGDVNWDINNPLLQNRTTKMNFETLNEALIKGNITQTWVAIP